MKGLSEIIAAFIVVFGPVASRGANLDRISAETGIPVATLQAERTSTGLGWGGLEKAHLLANSSGESFDTIVGKFHNGEGWGKIAHDYGPSRFIPRYGFDGARWRTSRPINKTYSSVGGLKR